jgi:hypothetical protein
MLKIYMLAECLISLDSIWWVRIRITCLRSTTKADKHALNINPGESFGSHVPAYKQTLRRHPRNFERMMIRVVCWDQGTTILWNTAHLFGRFAFHYAKVKCTFYRPHQSHVFTGNLSTKFHDFTYFLTESIRTIILLGIIWPFPRPSDDGDNDQLC